mmetsp:Transcript_17917/g.24787  ORF Transcript_17917/g.24787 Transcript_17917/m.24787 type:complete len:201 (-) Transcript_17917:201-803(-)
MICIHVPNDKFIHHTLSCWVTLQPIPEGFRSFVPNQIAIPLSHIRIIFTRRTFALQMIEHHQEFTQTPNVLKSLCQARTVPSHIKTTVHRRVEHRSWSNGKNKTRLINKLDRNSIGTDSSAGNFWIDKGILSRRSCRVESINQILNCAIRTKPIVLDLHQSHNPGIHRRDGGNDFPSLPIELLWSVGASRSWKAWSIKIV